MLINNKKNKAPCFPHINLTVYFDSTLLQCTFTVHFYSTLCQCILAILKLRVKNARKTHQCG